MLKTLKQRMSTLIFYLKRSLPLKIGVTFLFLLFFLAFSEPLVSYYRLGGHASTEMGVFGKFLPPSLEHPLGTDAYGRDMLALLLTGLRFSLTVGLIVGGMATLLSVSLAIVSGFKGGKIDTILSAITNAILVIPSFPIIMVVAAFVRVDLMGMCLILTAFSWPWSTRTIRAQILSLKERSYIELARISNLNDFEIMFYEILPNVIPFIIVGFAHSVVGAIYAETGLRMIGLGPGGVYSLGYALNQALNTGWIFQGRYLQLAFLIILLALLFFSFNLINMGIEEIFNPRLKKVTGE